MIVTICVADYTESGFTQEDAEKVLCVLQEKMQTLNASDVLCFDFSSVKFFTTLFFNIAFASLLKQMSFEEYERKIQLVNLSKIGQVAYDHSLENAKHFAAMPENERNNREKIVNEILKELQGE